ncbi:hypothetical protein B0H63DRAFT_311231 [Podospora didyma]|uniref:Uncharacterized protein n=1 Tax=Podospora didyma TaxID=330526 RepID=A0AAE0K5E6_9PEZI|nr:hypothetical protein B0H63DRAFT_311231 [Podospora didyma]
MMAAADLTPKPPLPKMATSRVNDALSLDVDRLSSQPRMFKKHKVLPHPRKDIPGGMQRSAPRKYDLEIKTPPSSRSLGPHGSRPLRPQPPKRAAAGPEPPPTPPAHSRTSSSSHSVKLTSPTYVSSPLQSAENVSSRLPTTPTNQQTPPTPNLTPDRTPPGPSERHAKPRPPVNDRIPSKLTVDSRTESFRTAPENPYSSEDEDDGRSTLRPILPSAKTSQSTVRQVNGDGKPKPQPVGLGLGLESSPEEEDLTPRTRGEFNAFDGEWANGGASGSEVEEEWDYNLGRNVTVKKRLHITQPNDVREEVIDDTTVTPTKATKALRSISLQESLLVYPARRVISDQLPVQTPPSNSESSISIDFKRSSIMSTKSTTSTVVEAILVEAAPQRRKTLRHVRKQITLRDSASDLSPASSAPTSVSAAFEDTRRPRLSNKAGDLPRESYASIGTTNSISSRKARREVWKNGGIPVVIVPERRTSVKSTSKEPSLRSTSSRSKKSPSQSSIQVSQVSKSKENIPHFERQPRRSRTLSESDGSRSGDQRTIDFPPTIPTRASSLSAPTSRNASRTGSLTAESLRAHNAFQVQQAHHALQKANQALEKLSIDTRQSGNNSSTNNRRDKVDKPSSKALAVAQPIRPSQPSHVERTAERTNPEVTILRAPSIESTKSKEARQQQQAHQEHNPDEDPGHRLSVDRYGDPFFGKRLSVQNTPFSLASVDTTATSHASHAEVSEAMAVNIYPHQNKSVMIVDHSAKPSESSSLERYRSSDTDTPTIRATDVDSVIPHTPPQQFSMNDVDSPLRNPRAPPEPPAIKFIPATPSGLTPTVEKQKMMGNYFEMAQEKPKRSMSLLRQTLTRRRTSDYGPSASRPPGFLTRTFSLTRSGSKKGRDSWADDSTRPGLRRHSSDDRPKDENRLHPFWQPAYLEDETSSSEDEEWYDEAAEGRMYKYPPVDNRPALPRRSISARMKRTFAILPARDDYDYDEDHHHHGRRIAPERRTIRRTPSGNLRVMKFRRSMESLPRIELNDGRPYTAPEHEESNGHAGPSRHLKFWRSPSLSKRRVLNRKRSSDSVKKSGSGFLPALGKRMNFPRRLSERRREKRTQELRRMISGPREVRDGVGDVIRRTSYRDTYYQQQQQQQQQQQFSSF